MDRVAVETLLAEQLSKLFEREVNTVNPSLTESVFDNALWGQLEEMGVPLLMVDESHGGAGLQWSSAVLVAALCGQHIVPLPLVETIIGAWALSQSGLAVPQGPIAVAPSIFTLSNDGLLSGAEAHIEWLADAGQVVISTTRQQEHYICLVDSKDLDAEHVDSLVRSPTSRVHAFNVQPKAIAPATSIGEHGLKPYLALMRSAQIHGNIDALVAQCVEYANTREQFGRPIAKFQAIQQMLAELATRSALANMAVKAGCALADRGDCVVGAAMAKSIAGEAATRAAAISHQLFGAIGITDELPLHYFTRRLWQWRDEVGSEHEWAQILGRKALSGGGEKLWAGICGEGW